MKKYILTITLIILMFAITTPALASLIDTMRDVVDDSGIDLRGGDPDNPELIIAGVIAYALSFMGVIFFVLIVMGGWLWMTAAGNEEKVTKAKKIIVSATIGLTIILLAYLITARVVFILESATT